MFLTLHFLAQAVGWPSTRALRITTRLSFSELEQTKWGNQMARDVEKEFKARPEPFSRLGLC